MRYVPVIVTQNNLSWAINENIRRIEAVLRQKALIETSKPMLNIDAGGNRIISIVSVDESDACTLDKFLEIRDAI